MKTRMVRTNGTALGPFLTLILNSTTKPNSANENASEVCDVMRISPASIMRREEAIAETQTYDVRRRILGSFVSLVLDLMKQKAEVRRQSAPVKKHSEQPICFRFSC